MNTREKGSAGEDLALQFLEQEGYRILERNFRFEHGEVDLIAREGADVVFIEVKARHSDEFGTPEEAITPEKEERLKRVAEGYFALKNISEQPCRFDVVAITYVDGKPRIRLIRNVFL